MSTTTSRPAETTTSTWTIDPQHSQVSFEVKHMMFATVRGRFAAPEGTVELGPDGAAEGTALRAVIESASIDTGEPERDEHLRSPDFLDVERFPEIRFESRGVERRGDDRLTVTGDLTIRDETREATLDVTELGRRTDPWGNERIGYRATTAIDRRDFGLTWNQALESGGVLVGHEVRITLDVQAVEADG